MDVAGQDGQVGLFVHEHAFVSALIEMACSPVPPVKVASVGNIEVAHEFGEVSEGCLDEQMKVVGHEDVAVKLDGVNMEGLDKNLQKALPVGIFFENIFLFVSPAADVVNSTRVLNP